MTHNKGPSVPRRRPRLGDSADARRGRQRDSGWATAELRTVGTKGTGLAPGTAQLGSALLPSCRRSLCPPHSSGLPSAHFVPISVPVPLAGADAGGTGTLPAGPSKSSSADSSGHTGTDTAVSPRPGTHSCSAYSKPCVPTAAWQISAPNPHSLCPPRLSTHASLCLACPSTHLSLCPHIPHVARSLFPVSLVSPCPSIPRSCVPQVPISLLTLPPVPCRPYRHIQPSHCPFVS